MIPCVFCASGGKRVPATAFGAQGENPGLIRAWAPICDAHAKMWNEGRDWYAPVLKLLPQPGTRSVLLGLPWRGMCTEGNQPDEAKRRMVFAVGTTPEDCIENFCSEMGESCENIRELEPEQPDHPDFQWGRRFVMDGTGMKAAGLYVPGGVIMTWWK